MIINAKITGFDRVTGTSATGQPVREAVAFAAECCLDQLTRAQRWALGASISSATQVCYVRRVEFESRGIVLPVAADLLHMEFGGYAITGEIISVIDIVAGIDSASHLQIFLTARD